MTDNIVSGVKKIAIGSIIAEYGCINIGDRNVGDLKKLVHAQKKAAQRIQKWFTKHPNAKAEHKIMFKNTFNENRNFLLAELFELVHDFDEDGIEEITKAIKASMIQQPVTTL